MLKKIEGGREKGSFNRLEQALHRCTSKEAHLMLNVMLYNGQENLLDTFKNSLISNFIMKNCCWGKKKPKLGDWTNRN